MPSHVQSSGVVTIEGLIGAGKSTLKAWLEAECARQELPIVFVDEPVETWQSIVDENGVCVLTRFYEDPAKWAFSFQMMAYISRLHLLDSARKENPHALIVAERSLSADRHVFAQMLHDSGDISTIDFAIYLKWFDYFAAKFEPEMIIYLDTPVDLAIERIARRSRDGEAAIDAAYIERLKTYTDTWIDREHDIVTRVIPTCNMGSSRIEVPVEVLGKAILPELVLRSSMYKHGDGTRYSNRLGCKQSINAGCLRSAWQLDASTGSTAN